MPLILAIDDDPERYEHLRRLLDGGADLIVGCCPVCVAVWLPRADAVLLDYDLDRRPCRCGREYLPRTTARYLDAVVAHGAPVIVTSASAVINRRALVSELRRGTVPVAEWSAIDIQPELRWLGQLWVWHVL